MIAGWPATINPTAKRNWWSYWRMSSRPSPPIPASIALPYIPAHHIQAGVKLSNLRQVVQEELSRRGQECGCIRCHEIKRRTVTADELELRGQILTISPTREHFLHFITHEQSRQPGLIAGFLRLSLPLRAGSAAAPFSTKSPIAP